MLRVRVWLKGKIPLISGGEMCPGIIKANYHLIIGGIIKRKAPVGSEAWEGRAGAEGLWAQGQCPGQGGPKQLVTVAKPWEWNTPVLVLPVCAFRVSLHSSCEEQGVQAVPAAQGPGAISRPPQCPGPLWAPRAAAVTARNPILTHCLLLAQPPPHQLNHSQQTIIPSQLCWWPLADRDILLNSCVRMEGSRPICMYLSVFSNLPFYSREVQECGLEELNALSRALGWVSSRTWLQCSQDSWPHAPARPSRHTAVQHRLNKSLPLFPQCPVSSKGRCENTLGLVLRCSRTWSVPSWCSKRIALTKTVKRWRD